MTPVQYSEDFVGTTYLGRLRVIMGSGGVTSLGDKVLSQCQRAELV